MGSRLRLFGPVNSGAATGGAGVATANANSAIVLQGELLAIYLTYNGSPPAGTTDVIISTQGTSPAPASATLLTISNAATDGPFFPRIPAEDAVGTAVTFDGSNEIYIPFPIFDLVNVKIQGANAGDSVDAVFLVRG